VTLSSKVLAVVTRAETAAATRGALVQAAAQLLDEGGPEAVTLREVGSRAGVSRGAPYGHFESKERLLAQLAVDAWDLLADRVEALRADADLSSTLRLERGLLTLIAMSREKPHLYALMFATPADDADAARAATRLENQFLAIVADVVGQEEALQYGALLMSTAHGIADMERSGHLHEAKWHIDGDRLVRLLIGAIDLEQARPGSLPR